MAESGSFPLRFPGFADLQVNGYSGVDFSAEGLTLDQVARVVQAQRERGTAYFCPTVITSAPEIYEKNLPVLAEACSDPELGPHLLGIHLEGPFISRQPGARGAHPASQAQKPDREFFDHLARLARDRVALVTLAPELDGSTELIRHIRKAGIAVSLGHHLAQPEDIAAAVEAGAEAVTHFGNGIPNELPRHANPLWSQLAEERLQIMLVTDGHHVPASLIKVVLRARGASQVIVVSDAAPIAGWPPGRYQTLGQHVVLERSGKLWNPEGNHLVGSSACQFECMNFLASLSILEETDLWKVGLLNPLRLLGLSGESLPVEKRPRVFFRQGRFEIT